MIAAVGAQQVRADDGENEGARADGAPSAVREFCLTPQLLQPYRPNKATASAQNEVAVPQAYIQGCRIHMMQTGHALMSQV